MKVCWIAAFLCLAPSSWAAESDADSYCRFVAGVAASQSDLLLAPEAFVSFGYVNESLTPGSSVFPSTERLSAGLSYNLVSLYSGVVTRSQAKTECARYRALSRLHAFLVVNKEDSSVSALEAKLNVLESALPEAGEILKTLHQSVTEGRATVEELNATELRADELRQLTLQAREALEGAPKVETAKIPISTLLGERNRAEEAVERDEARLREARAWGFTLRGGYDQVFGASNSPLPVFGTVTLSLNLGTFAQYSADSRARSGRQSWVRNQIEGVDQRVTELTEKLRARQRALTTRENQLSVLAADLAQRMRTVDTLPARSERLKRYREYLWFDFVKLKAEQAASLAQTHSIRMALDGEN